MKFILILWLTPFNATTATYDGHIISTEFDAKKSCLVALSMDKSEAKYVNGFCVPK